MSGGGAIDRNPETAGAWDAIVVGAGIAGLATALALAPLRVAVLSVGRLDETAASWLAQGGIAAALGADDGPERHAEDTLAAAAGLADPEIAALVAAEAPGRIAALAALGVAFARDERGAYHMGREGGHSRSRILHAGDETGRAVMAVLVRAVRREARIALLEEVEAERILLASGAAAGIQARRGEESLVLRAPALVLATGGIGGLYRHTTNPLAARGRGLALAARAGVALADLEFVQFHPTALAAEGADPLPLLTEALRGAGATLIDDRGKRFLIPLHPMAELAPRDIVARAVWREMKAGRQVYLDGRAAIAKDFAARFPAASRAARAAGLDPALELLPVVPAAHYHMGGIAVDDEGRSSLPGLWAAGEVASTGLHGANRLASNSLLEALVFAPRLASSIRNTVRAPARPAVTPAARPRNPPETNDLARLRGIMTQAVGLEREAAGLTSAIRGLEEIEARAARHSANLADAALAARLIATAALRRRASLGSHYRSDQPAGEPAAPPSHSRLTLADLEPLEEISA